MVRGRGIVVTAVALMYQWADTTRITRGRGTAWPNARHAVEYGLTSRACIGLPCPKKAAGITAGALLAVIWSSHRRELPQSHHYFTRPRPALKTGTDPVSAAPARVITSQRPAATRSALADRGNARVPGRTRLLTAPPSAATPPPSAAPIRRHVAAGAGE